ncbi:MAG TPA: diacylglycerol kinase [Phycisphaerae bacterium]|nr:diacylglycerol kinase [Phycisphaerae bacterium]
MPPKPVITSEEWLEIFQRNAGTRDFGPEQGTITAEQLAAIRASIQEFQLGETGEGMHLMRQAKKFAAAHNDPLYPAALRLFVAEEIRHARELKAFMDSVGMPIIKNTWVDGVFRHVRHLAGLELSIAVLVTAEIIATVYYAALSRATGSTRLRRLCEQILRDEADHVRFQCQRLAILRHPMSRLSRAWRTALYAPFFRLTLLIVWKRHGRALRAGGYSFPRFWQESTRAFAHAAALMSPTLYAWPKTQQPHWLTTRIRSVGYALSGISHLVRTQRNAWLHMAATLAVILCAAFLRVSSFDWCWLILAIAGVWTAEGMNTAVELLADAVSPGHHPLVGKAKDVAAGAVLLAAAGAAGIGAFVLGPAALHLGWLK